MRNRALGVALECGRYRSQATKLSRELAKYWPQCCHRSCGSLVEINNDEMPAPWMGIRFAQKPKDRLKLIQGTPPTETVDTPQADKPSTEAAETLDAEDAVSPSSSSNAEVSFEEKEKFADEKRMLAELKPALLEFMQAEEVVDLSIGIARAPEWHHLWPSVCSRLRDLELDPVQSVLVLDSLVRLGIRDENLMNKVVDQIESRYFGMKLGCPEHPALVDLLGGSTVESPRSFQALVDSLPLQHKVKLILLDVFRREKGRTRKKELDPEPDAKAKWKTMDPVEMELVERRQFEQGRIKVPRVRHVEAEVTKMPPGNKLRATLAVQLLQSLPGCTAAELALVAQASALSHKRLLHGDLLDDFHHDLATHVAALDTHEVVPHLLAFLAAFRNLGGAETWRVWRRKLIPAIVRLSRSSNALELLDQQQGLHPWTAGIKYPSDIAGDVSSLICRAHRASHLFICTATSHQVLLDTDLYDNVTSPLKSLLLQWRELHLHDSDESLVLLPAELIADVLGACASCGVTDACEGGLSLPGLLAELFVAQFGRDIHDRRFAISDLCVIAHSASLLLDAIPNGQHRESLAGELLQLTWEATESSLKQTKEHFVLMLLNAIVRSGSEELLTSQTFIDAVDEHLAQKLDYNADLLGRLVS